MPNLTSRQRATDLGRYVVDRANAGDVDGQPEGFWLWAIDQPDVLG